MEEFAFKEGKRVLQFDAEVAIIIMLETAKEYYLDSFTDESINYVAKFIHLKQLRRIMQIASELPFIITTEPEFLSSSAITEFLH